MAHFSSLFKYLAIEERRASDPRFYASPNSNPYNSAF